MDRKAEARARANHQLQSQHSNRSRVSFAAAANLQSQHSNRSRVSFAAAANTKRVSWNRSLSTRGRTSIAVAPCVANEPQQKQPRKGKPLFLKERLQNLQISRRRENISERLMPLSYWREPITKQFGTWATGNQTVPDPIPLISSRLEKWLLSKNLNFSCGPSSTLSKIFETPTAPIEASLASTTTSSHLERFDPFTFAGICEQSTPLQFLDLFSKYWVSLIFVVLLVPMMFAHCVILLFLSALNLIMHTAWVDYGETFLISAPESIAKVGEVLMEKPSEQAILLKVCEGLYDAALIRAWEKWDEKNGSENDHPKEFPEKQRYLVFVLQHGGKDLESFVLENFDEAKSLLVQVTAALAVAEAAYEFEHRDLHWSACCHFWETYFEPKGFCHYEVYARGQTNILQDIWTLIFSKVQKEINNQKHIENEGGCRRSLEGSFPRTNVLWLIYLVDILLLKKTYVRSSKNERDMRSLKKRLDKYDSAKEAIFDPFFEDLLVND
ncbi:hypothetical protein F3Y22_tig00111332pilonHSYRG00028 [Hibiscus syriacus]|uniref:non-specific serine/threonine protein kinase n=1 Tax=Hibiscus syriacus TaxID=106335 RepID=A0A6A2YPK7_HIBSY|nr:hypothetical protein F3Y22_tig00111332pilonHSYRG00028 [Hibiscus syriacus]